MATIAIKFCQECSNMLYPQGVHLSDNRKGKLVYKCRICEKVEEVDEPSYEAYRICSNISYKKTSEMRIDKTFAQDPTLSRSINAKCPSCGSGRVVFFQNDTGRILSRMELIDVCANQNCNHSWVHQNDKDYQMMDDDDSD